MVADNVTMIATRQFAIQFNVCPSWAGVALVSGTRRRTSKLSSATRAANFSEQIVLTQCLFRFR